MVAAGRACGLGALKGGCHMKGFVLGTGTAGLLLQSSSALGRASDL